MLAVVAGPIKAEPVSGGVAENCLAPQPGPVDRFLFEVESARLQFGAQFVQCLVLEIDRDAGLRRHGFQRMQ